MDETVIDFSEFFTFLIFMIAYWLEKSLQIRSERSESLLKYSLQGRKLLAKFSLRVFFKGVITLTPVVLTSLLVIIDKSSGRSSDSQE